MAPAGSTLEVAYRNYNKIRNLGDAINPLIIEHVSGAQAAFAFGAAPHVLGIGSIMFSANMRSHIWGTGMINDQKPLPRFDSRKVHALRGKETFSALRRLGHVIGDVPLGDPGIFLNEIVGPWTSQEDHRYRAAVVPHHASFDLPVFKTLAKDPSLTVVDMMTDDPDVLSRLALSDVIISQSLHGLVFGEALGKPTLWISSSEEDRWTFKFRDWESMLGRPQGRPFSLDGTVEDWISAAETRECAIDRTALREAFPLAETGYRPAAPRLGWRECLKLSPFRIEADPYDGRADYWTVAASDHHSAWAESLKRLWRKAIQGLGCPVYSVIVPPGHNPDPHLLDFACRVLDENTRYSFATLAPATASAGKPTISKGARLLGGPIVIRPNGRIDPAQPFVTIRN
jgi:hypothetical protein